MLLGVCDLIASDPLKSYSDGDCFLGCGLLSPVFDFSGGAFTLDKGLWLDLRPFELTEASVVEQVLEGLLFKGVALCEGQSPALKFDADLLILAFESDVE